MMKKKQTYVTPEVEIVELEVLQAILTGSLPVEDDEFADENEGGF